jgi:two-component system sensor histidine kinase/response regulator
VLARAGATATTVATNESAEAFITTLEAAAPDLVVVGTRIGRRPAVDVLREARRAGRAIPPALVLRRCTDKAIERDEHRYLGVVAFASAPARLADVVQAVRDARGFRAAERPRPASPAAQPEVSQARGRRRILLIEDNVVNQKVAAALLDRRGFEVVIASDGHLGVRSFDERPFDLVLLDIQMPTMDGFQALALLRAIDNRRGRHTPVIALTAHARDEDRQRCAAAGMDGYVAKPLVASHLYRVLDAALAEDSRLITTS